MGAARAERMTSRRKKHPITRTRRLPSLVLWGAVAFCAGPQPATAEVIEKHVAALDPEFWPLRFDRLAVAGPDALAVATNHGILTTRDGGKTWMLLCPRIFGLPGPNEPESSSPIASDVELSEHGTLFAGMNGRWASTDAGACTWRPIRELSDAYHLVAHRAAADHLYAVKAANQTDQEILHSKDRGNTFQRSAVIPTSLGRLHAGSAPHGSPMMAFAPFASPFVLWRSYAGSDNFSRRAYGFSRPNDHVFVEESRFDNLLLSVTDTGDVRPTELWMDPYENGAEGRLLTLPTGDRIATATFSLEASARKTWVAIRSPNRAHRLMLQAQRGGPFTVVNTSFPSGPLTFAHDRLYVAGEFDYRPGVWTSVDDGRTWQSIFRLDDVRVPSCLGGLCAASLAYITNRPPPAAGPVTASLPKFEGEAGTPATNPGTAAPDAGVAAGGPGPTATGDAGAVPGDAGNVTTIPAPAPDAGALDVAAAQGPQETFADTGGCACHVSGNPGSQDGPVAVVVALVCGAALARRRRPR